MREVINANGEVAKAVADTGADDAAAAVDGRENASVSTSKSVSMHMRPKLKAHYDRCGNIADQ